MQKVMVNNNQTKKNMKLHDFPFPMFLRLYDDKIYLLAQANRQINSK